MAQVTKAQLSQTQASSQAATSQASSAQPSALHSAATQSSTEIPQVTSESVGQENGLLLLIHGGAGDRGPKNSPKRRAQIAADLERALDAGYAVLDAGGAAEDAVCAAIHIMEDAPEFNAGRGAALTSDGTVQMDACLMTGDGEVGAVAGLMTARHPIDAARAVKHQTKHVLFAAPSENELADWGVATEDPSYFVTEQRKASLANAQAHGDAWEKHGTIGAVARDARGDIAAATSTGGITNQMPGRVGDSPLPGCGNYANAATIAVSGTGIGEAFVRAVAGRQLSDRIEYARQTPQDAAEATLNDIAKHRGDGGIIVVPSHGQGVIAFNSEMMNFGYRCGQSTRVNS
ncbi:MAG: isoaspartyl peptidase/L-asparaginase [Bifidobacterium sp.]|jgi:beta-aspartyl-peptidase (threonine type)|nr:isoaspartyl peptidase/L-asparaginase [Bifidobacterium sp.]